jgi:hypothetical protein
MRLTIRLLLSVFLIFLVTFIKLLSLGIVFFFFFLTRAFNQNFLLLALVCFESNILLIGC